jgi:hypothetical protein
MYLLYGRETVYSSIIAIVLLLLVFALVVFFTRHPYYRKYKLGERVVMLGGEKMWPSGEVIQDRFGVVAGLEVRDIYERGEGEKKSSSRFVPVRFDGEKDISYVNKIVLRSLK